MSMNRRQLFFSTAKTALAAALGGSWLSGKANAQASGSAPSASAAGAVHGNPERATATIDIDGRVLPPTPRAFGGVIKEFSKDSTPWWQPRVVPPEGAPNVLLIMTDDQGYGVSSTFGGVIPTPAMDRVANAGLRYTQFHSTALCSPTRAALITGRNHHSVGFGVITELSTGFPGYDSYIGPENVTVGRVLREHGYATSWFGKNHNTPAYQYTVAGPFDQWPSGMGFEYFYGFMGGETDQWTPYLFQNNTQIFPWVGKPGYNLTTDLADEAIKYMKELNAAAPDKPFFLYYVPGGSHSPHQPTKEWSDKFKGKFDMGWNALRDVIFANQSPRVRSSPSGPIAWRSGKRCRPTRRSCLPARPRCTRATRPIPTMRSAASSSRSRTWASSTTR
jgi:arylsulfatase